VKLLPPTTTEEALAALSDDGYVVLHDLLSAAQLDALREELRPHLATGPLGRNPFEGERTNRLYALLAKAESAAVLVEHPRVLAIMDALLLPNYLLTACQAINLLPGETEQAWHFDDGFYTIPRPRKPVSISTIWAIDDFTETNGATEMIPRSHLWDDEQGPDAEDSRRVPMVMPAGSAVVFVGTLWHRGGANRSTAPRCAISPQYCEPWARQQEAMMLAVGPAAARYSPRIRAMLGYSIHPPFMGFVNGVHPERLLDTGYDAAAAGARERAARFWDAEHPQRSR
jgi:ectoine hydroxylase-related dioxygenase (phytanoyl-CoA dioxygenase family)